MVALLECGIWEELTSGPYVMFEVKTGALYLGPYVMTGRRQDHNTQVLM